MVNQQNYLEALDYLYERLPMFSRIGKAALKPDLVNTLKLCEALGNPHHSFKSIHIAGTNGKGSVSHGMAAIMQYNGYKTGLYTSPHLIDFRERIRVDGVPVGEEWVVQFVARHKGLIEEIKPSFFEITVAMAFDYFAQEKVDIAVIETGVGGRLDSTNIITPLLSIITNISYDHKDLLGNTLPEIAAEKAGIIKQHVPVVIGEQYEETERVFFEHSVHRQAPLYYAQSFWGMVRTHQDKKHQFFKAVNTAQMEMYDLKTDLLGHYQQHNLKTILTSAQLIAQQGFNISIASSLAALEDVKNRTGLRGRWDWLSVSPAIVCDVAHNPAGLGEVLEQWKQVEADTKHIVIGFVKDKDVHEALALFPKDAAFYFCNADIPRALPAQDLKTLANGLGLKGDAYSSVSSAVIAARLALSGNDALLITGSFFIVGEAIEALDRERAIE